MERKFNGVTLRLVAIAIATCAALCLAVAVPHAAHAASAANKTIFAFDAYSYGTGNSTVHAKPNKTVERYDVTGDKKKDSVTFKVQGFDSSNTNFTSVKCLVNGKKAATFRLKGSWGPWAFYSARVKLLKLKSGKPFLAVYLTTDNQDGLHAVYKYSGGKFKKLLSQKSLSKKCESRWFSAKAKGNKIVVTHRWNDYAIGIASAKFSYKVKSGTLKRTSKKASKLSYHNMVTNKNGHPVATAAKSFKVYTKPSLKRAKSTIKKGTRLRVTSMRVQGKNIVFKVKTTTGRTGWFKPPTKYVHVEGTYGSWFKELGGVA